MPVGRPCRFRPTGERSASAPRGAGQWQTAQMALACRRRSTCRRPTRRSDWLTSDSLAADPNQVNECSAAGRNPPRPDRGPRADASGVARGVAPGGGPGVEPGVEPVAGGLSDGAVQKTARPTGRVVAGRRDSASVVRPVGGYAARRIAGAPYQTFCGRTILTFKPDSDYIDPEKPKPMQGQFHPAAARSASPPGARAGGTTPASTASSHEGRPHRGAKGDRRALAPVDTPGWNVGLRVRLRADARRRRVPRLGRPADGSREAPGVGRPSRR